MTGLLCQEVMEQMQRYLDRDLDETEYRQMLAHLSECPECTGLFERLLNVSSELEMLPKVTPPYSLVDAILPQLEAIDAGRSSAADLSPADRTAAISLKETGADRGKNVREGQGEKRATEKRRGLQRWISYPVAGGVLAAGLVLGFFIFQQDNLTRQEKSGALQEMNMAPGSARNSSGAGTGENAESDQEISVQKNYDAVPDERKTETGQQEPAGTEGNHEGSQAADPQPQAVAPAPPASSAQQEQEAGSENSAAKPSNSTETAPVPKADNKSADSSANQPDPTKRGAGEESSSPSGPLTSSITSGSADDKAPEESVTQDRSLEPQHESNEMIPNMALNVPPEEPYYGFAEPSEAATADTGRNGAELATEDGAYIAFITDDHKVAIRDQDGNTVSTSSRKWLSHTNLALVGWSDDHKLTYRVTLDNGEHIEYILSTDGTEEERR